MNCSGQKAVSRGGGGRRIRGIFVFGDAFFRKFGKFQGGMRRAGCSSCALSVAGGVKGMGPWRLQMVGTKGGEAL